MVLASIIFLQLSLCLVLIFMLMEGASFAQTKNPDFEQLGENSFKLKIEGKPEHINPQKSLRGGLNLNKDTGLKLKPRAIRNCFPLKSEDSSLSSGSDYTETKKPLQSTVEQKQKPILKSLPVSQPNTLHSLAIEEEDQDKTGSASSGLKYTRDQETPKELKSIEYGVSTTPQTLKSLAIESPKRSLLQAKPVYTAPLKNLPPRKIDPLVAKPPIPISPLRSLPAIIPKPLRQL